MKAAAFEYARAGTLAEAAGMLRRDGARIMAGCQSLGPMLNMRLARPGLLIDITHCEDGRRAEEEPDAVVLGACVTHAMLEDGRAPDVGDRALARVASGVAYRAIRTRGTIGGSLAHADPAGDWPTALVALGAEVEVVAADSTRRRIAVADLIEGAFATVLQADEVIETVRIPKLSPGGRFGYHKLSRKIGEFAEGLCAVLRDPERGICRIAIGATDGKPHVVDDATAIVEDPARARETVQAAGIGDAIHARLHAAAIRRAIAELSRP